MGYLIDTSILVRLANSRDELCPAARHAVFRLRRANEMLHVTAQNVIEFWNVATRPVASNGLGLTSDAVKHKVAGFEAVFSLLDETPEIFPQWKALVESHGVQGKQVHDARLVAVCHVHHVTHLLTFNVAHFTRYASFAPGLVVVDAASLQ